MSELIDKIRKELAQNGDEKTRQSGERFFKEEVRLYGVKTPVANRIGKDFFKTIKGKSKSEIFCWCDELWKSGYLEESIIACGWSYSLNKQFEKQDFALFEKWISAYVNNWASCDTLCNHTIGTFVEMFPAFLQNLKKWAKSSNRWMKRAAAVTLIIPARHGKFLPDIFEIANILLIDRDDLVQKGYGWMLKAASEAHQKDVLNFVVKNKKIMPRTALRYAIEKMDPESKRKAMSQ